MHVIKPTVHHIRPTQIVGKMQGRVVFTATTQTEAYRGTATYDCTCDIPRGKTSQDRIATLKTALIQDAMRQARSKASTALFLLTHPSEQLYVA